MIHHKQLGYYNYVIVGSCALRLDQMQGIRWDVKTGEVVVMATGGRCYSTGLKDKQAFEEYLAPKAKGKKKLLTEKEHGQDTDKGHVY